MKKLGLLVLPLFVAALMLSGCGSAKQEGTLEETKVAACECSKDCKACAKDMKNCGGKDCVCKKADAKCVCSKDCKMCGKDMKNCGKEGCTCMKAAPAKDAKAPVAPKAPAAPVKAPAKK